jgi:hypothetical protein
VQLWKVHLSCVYGLSCVAKLLRIVARTMTAATRVPEESAYTCIKVQVVDHTSLLRHRHDQLPRAPTGGAAPATA